MRNKKVMNKYKNKIDYYKNKQMNLIMIKKCKLNNMNNNWKFLNILVKWKLVINRDMKPFC